MFCVTKHFSVAKRHHKLLVNAFLQGCKCSSSPCGGGASNDTGQQAFGESGCGSFGSGSQEPPCAPCPYDARKYGHYLPDNNVRPNFEPLPNIPTGIFRHTTGEVLGPGACKCGHYQNPEYFSFHHMTFFDIHLILRCCRMPSPKTNRKP